MKTFLFSLLLAVFLIIGCADNFDNTLVSTPITTEKVTSRTSSNPSTLNSSVLNNNEVYRIPSFKNSDALKASKLINGANYTEFVLDTTYINSEGRVLKVYARLKFPAGAFEGTQRITMIPNPEDLSIQLFPHIIFNETVKLDYTITGLNLEAMGYTEIGHVDFVYFSENGDIELVQNDRSNVHPQQQQISVLGGKLSHFSRYGWSR